MEQLSTAQVNTEPLVLTPLQIQQQIRYLRSLLPATGFESFDLEAELVEQYHEAKRLMDMVRDDDATPVNHKAQLANSVLGLLNSVAKLQGEIYTTERMKKVEKALVKTLKDFEGAPELLKLYEENLNKLL